MSVLAEQKRAGPEDRSQDLNGLSRLDALATRFGDDIADINLERALEVLADADFSSPRDRACFWGRDGSAVPDPTTGARKPLNEVLVNLFMQQENAALLAGPGVGGKPPNLFVTMHQLEAGRAFSRVVQNSADRPEEVMFNGVTYRNDTYASTDALIDAVAGCYSQQASGVVTVSISEAEPDSFFSLGREIDNLLTNPDVTGIRVLDLSDELVDPEVALERGDELSKAGMQSSFFRRGQLAVSEQLFSDKHRWEQWQRNSWLNTAIRAIRAHESPVTDMSNLRYQGLAYETNLASPEIAQARFQCELYRVVRSIGELERLEYSTGIDRLRYQGELHRLDQCAATVRDVPGALSPVKSSAAADLLNRYHVKTAVAGIAERDRLLSSYWTDDSENLRAAADVTALIRQRLDLLRRDT
jgi:hypothetical protein